MQPFLKKQFLPIGLVLAVVVGIAYPAAGVKAGAAALAKCEAFCKPNAKCTVCSVACNLGSLTRTGGIHASTLFWH